ncbi:phosphatase PAP2/dual specificity phosphatase family protein [Acinetobacter boissieri]|uniref:Protein-tyrosine phosphatase n=1 Tax=Acinetobacter boissieri TaxID=1219383 RepID=A0A1G6H6R9_9GAMM|nr:phosphatase PAP2/dual specificity phosphatase family protein [Acinetobacter boissieri]SDB89808.1 Protein-tyrosine phosphatase [Acinetobacter boissieri]
MANLKYATIKPLQFLVYKCLALALLGFIFFTSYGFANWYATTRLNVPEIMFAWEKDIPFVPWTIVPYWSIDLFYALSVLICANVSILSTHIKRLLTAQLICVSCFLIFPLEFTAHRPESHGFFGMMYNALMGFDKPFNQAPSLHIVLLVILWVFYAQRTQHVWRWIVHIWAFLIGVSVLTTWQHHFIDIPTGVVVAALCLWVWPDSEYEKPLKQIQITADKKRTTLATYYFIGSISLCVFASYFKSFALWLLWPSLSLLMVALIYMCLNASAFQKNSHGRMSVAVLILLTPYLIAAWVNSRLWTRKKPQPSLIIQNETHFPKHIQLYLGRISRFKTLQQFDGLLDTCAELPVSVPAMCKYQLTPILDLTTPTLAQLQHGAEALESLVQKLDTHKTTSNILISCALGYSRSACVLAAWLIYYRHAKTVQDAVNIIKVSRPFVVLKLNHLQVLQQLLLIRQ